MELTAEKDMLDIFKKLPDSKIKDLYENKQYKFTPEILVLLKEEYINRNLSALSFESNITSNCDEDINNAIPSIDNLYKELAKCNEDFENIEDKVSFTDTSSVIITYVISILLTTFFLGVAPLIISGLNWLISKLNLDSSISLSIASGIYVFVCCVIVFSYITFKVERLELKEMKKVYGTLVDAHIYKLKNMLSEIQNTLHEGKIKIRNQNHEINKLINIRDSIFTPTNISYPWIAELYADLHYIYDKNTANYLKTKKNPALKASDEVLKISKEKRALLKKCKELEYQLNYYEKVFPWLEDFKETDPIETFEILNNFDGESDDEYSKLKKWLSPDEYNKLSSTEKYQLALDRYKNRKNKSNWEIGIEYERYIGYLYENKGYKVTYNGAVEGLNDLGRDIIAENRDKILIVQCKYWKKEKNIHEKHIFQLFGTMVLKKLTSPKNVYGIFITSATISDVAKQVAKELQIELVENKPIDKNYPCIKCNINRQTGEKIYHLPFDQQYDNIRIEPHKGELYVDTIENAEKLGFRRAIKWVSNSNLI